MVDQNMKCPYLYWTIQKSEETTVLQAELEPATRSVVQPSLRPYTSGID